MSNSLHPVQARRIVGPGLGPNCLPMLSADENGRQRVKDDIQVNNVMLKTYRLWSLVCIILLRDPY